MKDNTAEKPPVTPYDAGYKSLFSHKIMVEDLLRGFIHHEWVSELDFSTLEKIPGSYVSEDFHQREEDIVWRVKWQGEWIFIYLLLEFQSQVDEFMALRMMVYLGLLYEDLRKRNQLENGKLPPVFPIVLYNGKPIWDAPTNIIDLIAECPKPLRKYLPSLPFHLMSEQHYSDKALSLKTQNFAKALFRLEKSRKLHHLLYVIRRLIVWLDMPQYDSLRRSFTMFIKRITFAKHPQYTNLVADDNLQEVYSVLAEKLKDWLEESKAEGEARGETRGEARGQAQGLRQALLKQLELKFGQLSTETIEHVEHMSVDKLMMCLEKVLVADNLAQVLALDEDI